MYNEGRNDRRLYVASLAEDVPNLQLGDLIPKQTMYSAPRTSAPVRAAWYLQPTLLLTFSVMLFAISIGTTGYSVFRGQSMSAAAPTVQLTEQYTYEPEELNYGIELALGEDTAFLSARHALILDNATFVELNLVSMELTYYEEGESVETMPILSKGEDGSWWQVPAGLYTVDQKKQKRYSSFGNIYMPWSISFEGNFYLNGVPHYEDGAEVPEEYTGGGIRLSNENAEKVFNTIAVGTQILVHETNFENDGFLYAAKVPGIQASEYLIADLDSSTVLAANDLDAAVPIASLTKLMTALVAAEHIDLDMDVNLGGAAPYVTTLIPRLAGSYNVSMYSLLQLLLMESSNEAAEAIANEYGRASFIALMNKKAEALGMTDTLFTDSSGLDDGNVSTVQDLLRLTQYIHHNRGFILELTQNQHLPTAYTNGQFGKLANFNEIDAVGFIAGKVGETRAAGQTSISLHSISIDDEERTMVIILLGSDERTADVTKLYSFVTEQFN